MMTSIEEVRLRDKMMMLSMMLMKLLIKGTDLVIFVCVYVFGKGSTM